MKLHVFHFFYNLVQIALLLWSDFLNWKTETYWFAEGIKWNTTYNVQCVSSCWPTSPVVTLFLLFQVLFSRQVVSDSLWPHGLRHARLPCPPVSPGFGPSSCPLHWRCHATMLSSVTVFSFCLQSFPASGSFPKSQRFSQVAKVLELQLQHQSFQWIFTVDFL